MLAVWLLAGTLEPDPLARNPFVPGFPPCEDGQTGYWQPYGEPDIKGETHIYLALTSVNFLDPSTVICWLDAEQRVRAEYRPRNRRTLTRC